MEIQNQLVSGAGNGLLAVGDSHARYLLWEISKQGSIHLLSYSRSIRDIILQLGPSVKQTRLRVTYLMRGRIQHQIAVSYLKKLLYS